jgi:peptidoglycan/LPS O-acetylase OafA/YrhL
MAYNRRLIGMTPERIRAIMPMYLASMGLLIAVATFILSPNDTAAGLGLAGTAIAGAAGLAEPTRN